jgi:hypothetical protein
MVLELLLDDKPPRSWKKDEQKMWKCLPEEIRYALGRREEQRDRAVRLAQNEAADLRNEKKNAEGKATEEAKPNGHAGESHSAAAQ